MLKNYFQIAWRNLSRNKGFTIINILGLALGMAVVILIGLWIKDEVSYNKSLKNYDRITQVMHNWENAAWFDRTRKWEALSVMNFLDHAYTRR